MSWPEKVAEAPLRSVSIPSCQRGDQGGLRAHNNAQLRPGMEQDTTFPEEIFQGPEIQLQQPSLWSDIIFSSLELLLLASVAIVCLPFTRAARLGKPDPGGMSKVDKLPTKTDREPPGFQLPREVNKYLNRWKPSKSMVALLPHALMYAQSSKRGTI